MVRRTSLISVARPAAIAPAAPGSSARIMPVLEPGTACAPFPGRSSRGECVVTASGLLQARPRLGALLGATGCAVRAVARWADLLDAIEDGDLDASQAGRAGVALVDLDAANRAASGGVALSGYRLVALLARRARSLGFALVVQTALDYSEIEDLIHLGGVCALSHPDLKDEQVATQIQRALHRWPVPELPRSGAAGRPATDVRIPAIADTTLAEAAAWVAPGLLRADAVGSPPAFG